MAYCRARKDQITLDAQVKTAKFAYWFLITRSLKSKEVTTIGPLQLESKEKKDDGDLNSSKPEEQKHELLYNFSHWGR